jgi:hypothetical protein
MSRMNFDLRFSDGVLSVSGGSPKRQLANPLPWQQAEAAVSRTLRVSADHVPGQSDNRPQLSD